MGSSHWRAGGDAGGNGAAALSAQEQAIDCCGLQAQEAPVWMVGHKVQLWPHHLVPPLMRIFVPHLAVRSNTVTWQRTDEVCSKLAEGRSTSPTHVILQYPHGKHREVRLGIFLLMSAIWPTKQNGVNLEIQKTTHTGRDSLPLYITVASKSHPTPPLPYTSRRHRWPAIYLIPSSRARCQVWPLKSGLKTPTNLLTGLESVLALCDHVRQVLATQARGEGKMLACTAWHACATTMH